MIDCYKKRDRILRILFHLFVFLYLIPASLNAQRALSVRDTKGIAPAFEFITLNSESISSGNLRGKIIVLDFWSTGCTPCVKSMPQMEKFHQKYKNDERVVIYLVNSGWESIEKARSFADAKRKHFLFFSWGRKI